MKWILSGFEFYLQDPKAQIQTVVDTVISGLFWFVSGRYELLITVGGGSDDFSQTTSIVSFYIEEKPIFDIGVAFCNSLNSDIKCLFNRTTVRPQL